MNYIKRLELDIKQAEKKAKNVDEIITELFNYVNSSKFRCGDDLDGYVNIKDITTYLDRVRSVN
tara:strand:- start:37754 stop:37945 length:192 start_codon:yes stop_codon:yes gene_type:complete